MLRVATKEARSKTEDDSVFSASEFLKMIKTRYNLRSIYVRHNMELWALSWSRPCCWVDIDWSYPELHLLHVPLVPGHVLQQCYLSGCMHFLQVQICNWRKKRVLDVEIKRQNTRLNSELAKQNSPTPLPASVQFSISVESQLHYENEVL